MSLMLIMETIRLWWARFLVEHADLVARNERLLAEFPWRE